MLNSQVTTSQHMEREKAYDVVSQCAFAVSFFLLSSIEFKSLLVF